MSHEIHITAQDGGQAAGRDIHNWSRHMPESQLQAEFKQRTGMWCPRAAREWLENLADHGFTARELAIAWNARTLRWDTRRAAPQVVTAWYEAAAAYLVWVTLTAYVLAAGLPLTLSAERTSTGLLAVAGLALMYLGCCWMAVRFLLSPRRIAQRVGRTLEESPARAEQLEAQRAALRAKAAKRVEALADKTVELLNAIDSRLTRIEDKQATFEKEAFRSFATKADVAEAKFSIIVWVVSAIFLAQLLPVAASLVKHYFP